jgi:DNA-binding response OmpR family regulator
MPTSSATSQLTVLLVDDSRTVLAIYGRALSIEGFQVLKATTSGEALELTRRPDVAIHLLATDLVLPDTLRLLRTDRQGEMLHGLQLMRQVARLRPEIKTLLFSGQSDEMLKRLGAFKNGVPFLRKPFSAETFLRMVRTVLDSPQEAPAPCRM